MLKGASRGRRVLRCQLLSTYTFGLLTYNICYALITCFCTKRPSFLVLVTILLLPVLFCVLFLLYFVKHKLFLLIIHLFTICNSHESLKVIYLCFLKFKHIYLGLLSRFSFFNYSEKQVVVFKVGF